jgi:hypothetical protein
MIANDLNGNDCNSLPRHRVTASVKLNSDSISQNLNCNFYSTTTGRNGGDLSYYKYSTSGEIYDNNFDENNSYYNHQQASVSFSSGGTTSNRSTPGFRLNDSNYFANSDRNSSFYESNVEREILNSTSPIQLNEHDTDEIDVDGERGLWANRSEVQDWSRTSQVPLDDYELNRDPHPQIINKRSSQVINFIQELAVR